MTNKRRERERESCGLENKAYYSGGGFKGDAGGYWGILILMSSEMPSMPPRKILQIYHYTDSKNYNPELLLHLEYHHYLYLHVYTVHLCSVTRVSPG